MAQIIRVTRGCEYAMAAMVWIAGEYVDRPLQAEAIAMGAGIPCRFAKNIFTQLANAALLRPHRGAVRGYSLGRPASQITLLDIIEAYDGPFVKPWCFANRDMPCDANAPCALHDHWLTMRESIQSILAKVTLQSLVDRGSSRTGAPIVESTLKSNQRTRQ